MSTIERDVVAPVHCPHCAGALPAGWTTPRAGRCPICRLVIGAGRSIDPAAAARRGGSVAGLLANDAHRVQAEPIDPGLVIAALHATAWGLRCNLSRIRMVDYCRLSASDPGLPPIGVVLATFSTWKRARAAAVEVHGDERGLQAERSDPRAAA